ncbi:MAG TPA: beta-propeller fold lactonase family protein [Thermoanaerobaculia bacterium]|nr:beta-propeller fold lactonase family protein [Thermoanaerobaculia bacterium]
MAPLIVALAFVASLASASEPLPLPTGHRLDPAAPSFAVGNFPLTMVLSPERNRLVVLLCGWRQQGLQVVDRASGEVLQTLDQPAAFLGLAFAPDGKTLWASGGFDDAVYAYAWRDGVATFDRKISLHALPVEKAGTRYPAGLAFSSDGRFLYVAENLGDTFDVVDVARGKVVQRLAVDRYPYTVAVSRDGMVYVSCWGDDTVHVFKARSEALQRVGRIVVGRHPSALVLNAAGTRLFVASASTDSIAVVDTRKRAVIATLSDAPPTVREGSTPNALALSDDGSRLLVAEGDNNAVAVFALSPRVAGRKTPSTRDRLLGRVPVEWYPAALAVDGDTLFVANAKGHGTVPNPGRTQPNKKLQPGTLNYTLSQLRGSITPLRTTWRTGELAKLSARVAGSNNWTRPADSGRYPPFRHVIYIIKENRTYDQVFGDMAAGDGDPSLLFFGRAISPNHHALADRFGLFDRFFVNAEVSGDGHNWSTSAYATDYVEKTVASNYSDRGRTYDYQGMNRDQFVDDDDDVNAPASGYLWDAALRKGITFRDYGEFIVGRPELGVGTKGNYATKRAIDGHTNLDYPGFDTDITDQHRLDVWLGDFRGFLENNDMPALQIIWLPNDHTAGAAAGKLTPQAYMADNDLALGRLVDAVSHSKFWKDTVIFVLEDDAQSGPDHVDSHRSILMPISAYSRAGAVHRFVNTTDVLATIEEILGLDPLSQYDRYGRPLHDIFASEPDLTPYAAITPDVDRTQKNPEGEAAKQSANLDLSRADAVDDDLLNRILWRAIKGESAPYPGPTRAPSGFLR